MPQEAPKRSGMKQHESFSVSSIFSLPNRPIHISNSAIFNWKKIHPITNSHRFQKSNRKIRWCILLSSHFVHCQSNYIIHHVPKHHFGYLCRGPPQSPCYMRKSTLNIDRYCPLEGFLQLFRAVSSDYGKARMLVFVGAQIGVPKQFPFS